MTLIFTAIAFFVLKYGFGLSYLLSVVLTPVAFLVIMALLMLLPPYGKLK